jgi:hypothetical protein
MVQKQARRSIRRPKPDEIQPTPLVIGKPDPSLTELFEKDAVLFPKELDRGLLVSIDPARELLTAQMARRAGMAERLGLGFPHAREETVHARNRDHRDP